MAFPVAVHLPTLGGFDIPGLVPRVEEARSYPRLHARNTSTPQNTVNLYIDSYEGFQFGASIVSACADQTVYALQCTAAPSTVDDYGLGQAVATRCGANAPVATVTYDASHYEYSTSSTTTTLGHTVKATVTEVCAFAGTTAATCTGVVAGSVDKTATSTTVTVTQSGSVGDSAYKRYDVEITAGAEKTTNPAATCDKKGAAATLNSKTMALWALAGVMGLSGVLTM